jgi:syntaxin 18
MAHDITDEFRIIVDQKLKELGDSRRTRPRRPTHPTHADSQGDNAPPFMQAYMKEAYTIVSHHFLSISLLLMCEKLRHITSLTRMLAAVRRAYLDVHGRPPPLTRQVARTPDISGIDAWADIKYLTNAERDQIDMQARTILARCADHVRDMEALEKSEILLSFLIPDVIELWSQIGQSASLNHPIPFTAFSQPCSCLMMSLLHPSLSRLTVQESPGTSRGA